jgi:hypothetical protein
MQTYTEGGTMKLSALVALLCLILLPIASFAQGEPGWNKHSLGANFELSLPMGDFSDIAGTGYGGNARYQFGFDQKGVFTATAGYLVWSKKEYAAGNSSQPSAFNIFLGGKWYLYEGLFASVEGGLYFLNFKYEGNVVGAEGNTTRFMLPIGIGYQKSGFEVGVRYMLIDVNANSFSFTLGYNFAL